MYLQPFINHFFKTQFSYEQIDNAQVRKCASAQVRLCAIVLVTMFLLTPGICQQTCTLTEPPPSSALIIACNQYRPEFEEISCFPEATVKLAFHLQDAPTGENFTCDINDPLVGGDAFSGFYAPYTMLGVIDRVKDIYRQNPGFDGNDNDTRIRFEWYTGDLCTSISTYAFGASDPTPIPGAINVYFRNTGSHTASERFTMSGAAPLRGSRCIIYNFTDVYVNPQLYSQTGWWSAGHVLSHEIGHNFGLLHAFDCRNECDGIDYNVEEECGGTCRNTGSGLCFGNGTNDYLMAYSPGQRNLGICEIEGIWSHLLNQQPSYLTQDFCSTPCSSELILDVGSNITWDTKKRLMSNVRIANGTTLTIQCEVEMGPERRITVDEGGKLIVDGGKITALCETDYWDGIHVIGNKNDAFGNADVELINGAILEKVKTTAVMMMPPLPWPQQSEKGNGVVHATDATFQDVWRAVALVAFNPSLNSSTFDNCTFNDAKYGITNWNNLAVNIENSTFTDIRKWAIGTEGGSMNISDNIIEADEIGVFFADVTATLRSTVSRNEFDSDDAGINTFGATFSEQLFESNTLYGNNHGMFLDGDNHYMIENNVFRTTYGIVTSNNGTHTNEVHNNWFDQNFVGIGPNGTNDNLNFYLNCFNTTNSDVSINGNVAKIISGGFNAIDREFIAANNCFSHAGIPTSTITDIGGNHSKIDYVEEENIDFDYCYFIMNPSSILVSVVGLPNSDPCIGGFTGGDGFTGTICHPDRTYSAGTAALGAIDSEISDVQSDGSISNGYKITLISELSRCRKRVIRMLVELDMEARNFNAARNTAQLDNSEDGWVMIYSSYVYQKDLTAAENYLDVTGPGSQNWQDFKATQYINIDDLRNGPVELAKSTGTYISPERKAQIKTVYKLATNHENPYSGYAKALYFRMTGEILRSPVNTPIADSNYEPYKEIKSIEFKVFPNPTTGLLKISMNSTEETNIQIISLTGREVRNITTSSFNSVIDLRNEASGVYIVLFSNSTGLIERRKIVVQ